MPSDALNAVGTWFTMAELSYCPCAFANSSHDERKVTPGTVRATDR
jgi:hypothetical protein